jgi:beta-glucosidase-like glycosyl hydrolase
MPFQAAIKSGVDLIMAGHFIAEPGDSKYPISLSSYWMTDVLKKEMKFQGLVVIDNIEMKPIARMMSFAKAAVLSFNAGADIIMVSHERQNQDKVFKALLDAARNGEISSQRLNNSLKRIIKAKKKILSHNTRPPGRNLSELSRLVAEESVTFLSLKDTPFQTINTDDKVLFTGYDNSLFKAIKETFPHAESFNTTLVNYKKLHPDTPIVEYLENFDALIIDANYTDASRIIKLCNDAGQDYVVLETRFSKIQGTLTNVHPKHLILIFEKSRDHLEVAFEILSGLRPAKGKIPDNFSVPPDYTY